MHNVETRAKRFNSDCAILNKLFREYMDIAAEKLKSTSQWNLRKLSIHLLTNFTDFSGKTYRTKPTMWGARIALFVLTLMAWVSDLMPNWGALVSLAIAYIMTGGHYTFYLLWHTGMRDARGAYRYLRLLVLVYYYKKKDFTVPKVFARTAKTYGDKACLIFEDQTWSFNDLEAYSNRVAYVFLRAGFKHGDCVALFMENRLEYVGLWLGCTKLGLVPALINNNLTGQPLLHSIRSASATALIYGSELGKAIQEISTEIDPGLKLFVSGSKTSSVGGVTNLDPEIVNSNSDPLPDSVQKLNHFNDKLLYIYTSGTTGIFTFHNLVSADPYLNIIRSNLFSRIR